MTGELGKALLLAQHAMPKIGLDSENPHFRSRFVSLPKLLETVRPILNDNGLVLIQSPAVLVDGAQVLRTELMHAESGELVFSETLLMLSKNDAQAQGSAITYARRYALLSMLGLAGDEDDDGHAATAAASVARPTVPRGYGPGAPQPDVIAKAKAAQEAKGDVPTEAGDPRNVLVHFGKNQGKRLGDLTKRQLEWYANQWEPNPAYDSDSDRRLKLGVQMILGLAQDEIPAPGPDDGDVPF